MWIFTDTGFVSAVADTTNDDQLIVRSRDRTSLQPLAELTDGEISTGTGTDYPHRLRCSRAEFTTWLTNSINNLNYPNFKSQVVQTRGSEFAHPLMTVWAAMHQVEDDLR